MREKGRKPTLPEAVGSYAAKDTARFHMPGHKGRGVMGPAGAELSRWDVTEIDGTDDLHAPEGAILQTERDYAAAYGARHSFLCVNGSTGCALAMLLAIGREKRVLLARDCHKSAVAGVALAGHDCDFIYPSAGEGTPFSRVVTAAAVETALRKRPADAVYITSPNYYGAYADVPAIAAVCRRYGALLLCDAAHGAHFPFTPSLAAHTAAAADLWCVSAHKTLRAFTQTAVLHASNDCPIEDAHIRRMLALTETSSPSYLLMTSLDWALFCAKGGEWAAHEKRIRTLRARFCAELPEGVALLGGAWAQGLDNTRLTFLVNGRGISGHAAQEALVRAGVVPEMADLASVVCITSPADADEWYERLLRALSALPRGDGEFEYLPPVAKEKPPAMRARDAVLAPAEQVPLEACAGRVAAVAAGAYPPGIATFFPGERIDAADVRRMTDFRAAGLSLFGITDGCAACVKTEKRV